MGGLVKEVRVALRSLLRARGYSAAAVCILAISIGSSTALFTVFDAALLRPLPYRDPDRLVLVDETTGGNDRLSVSYPDFLDWRDRNRSFEALGAWKDETYNLSGIDRPERVKAWMFSAGLLRILGTAPMLGREFSSDEDRPGGAPVVLLTHAFWRTRMGGDPTALGRTLSLDGKPYSIVGILAEKFRFPGQSGASVVVPLGQLAPELNDRSIGPGIVAIGRLKRSLTLAQARAEMEALGRAIHEEHPGGGLVLPLVLPMHGDLVRDVRPRLWFLLGAVVLVLAIAIANVANLTLARGIVRQRELAVRAALGAGRGRLVRELLVESAILGVAGGALGVLLAIKGLDLLLAAAPDSLGSMADVRLDSSLLVDALAASLVTGLLFGMVPALAVTKTNLYDALRAVPALPRRGNRTRSVLIVVEIALAFVLLVGAGLTLRAYGRLEHSPLGFQPRGLLTFALTAPPAKYPTLESIRVLREQLAAKLAALPGVTAVALGRSVPMDDDYGQIGLKPKDAPRPEAREMTIAVYYPVSPGFLKTMGIPLLSGREFTSADTAGASGVAIVDETLASRLFPRQDPRGRWISNISGTRPMQIVGVAAHVAHFGPGQVEATPYQMYYPLAQMPADMIDARRVRVVLRTAPPPLSLAGSAAGAVAAIDPDQPIFDVKTMEQLAASTLNRERFSIALLDVFAGIAIVLAATGLYAVLAYDVARRTHEIGIRMALGADPGAVRRMVVRESLRLTITGLSAGAIIAAVGSRLMTGLIEGVRPLDPSTYVAVAALLLTIALAASWVPARRATRLEPIEALREQ